MVRLFVGLELSPEMKDALDFVRGGVEGAHWQGDDQLHLTLAFIGDVPLNVMRQIEDELSKTDFEPFDLTLAGVDMFGNIRQPKNLWAGVVDETPLQNLHEKILTALERIDVETDRRRYKPHVTLARFPRNIQARISDWLTANSILKTPAQRIDHFSLFSSQRSSEGPSYLVEARFGDGAVHDAAFELVENRAPEGL